MELRRIGLLLFAVSQLPLTFLFLLRSINYVITTLEFRLIGTSLTILVAISIVMIYYPAWKHRSTIKNVNA